MRAGEGYTYAGNMHVVSMPEHLSRHRRTPKMMRDEALTCCSLPIYAAENQQRPNQEGYVGHRDHHGDRRCHDRGVAGGFGEGG